METVRVNEWCGAYASSSGTLRVLLPLDWTPALAAVVSRPAAGCDIRESVNLLHQARWVGEEEAPRSRGIPRKVGRKFSAFLLAVHMRGHRGSRVHHPVEKWQHAELDGAWAAGAGGRAVIPA